MDRDQKLTKATNLTIFILTALISGFGSAWMTLEHGFRLTTERDGQWKSWTTAGRPDADPYARAHLSRSGRLPLSSKNIQYFIAKTDSEGYRLLGSCEYLLESNELLSDWWSLTAFDGTGKLQRNKPKKYTFNSSTVLRATSGRYKIRLSSEPRDGNWLPSDPNDKVTLVFRLHAPANAELNAANATQRRRLPTIRRVSCG